MKSIHCCNQNCNQGRDCPERTLITVAFNPKTHAVVPLDQIKTDEQKPVANHGEHK